MINKHQIDCLTKILKPIPKFFGADVDASELQWCIERFSSWLWFWSHSNFKLINRTVYKFYV